MEVFTKNRKPITIDQSRELQRGGEGAIIKLSPKEVAKIYHQGISGITEKSFQHLRLLPKTYFVIPNELFYNAYAEVIGFSMEFLPSKFFPLSNLFGKSFCTQNSISFRLKTEIADKLIEAVKIAHNRQIVIGDLNQYNILFSLSGEVKFIDTDSYQTPENTHSGRLLDEIRDHLYQGKISRESDYFALSVVIFNLFTHTHPFKGISKNVKKLADRMKMKLPIFSKDIKQPKVFTPIQSPDLQKQFERFYLHGERFMISLSGKLIQQKIKKPQIQQLSHAELSIKQYLKPTAIIDAFFNENQGFISTKDNFIIFDASNNGNLFEILSLKRSDFEQVFLTEKFIFAKAGENFLQIEKNGSKHKITNFKFCANAKVIQYGNILLSVADNIIYELLLEEVFKGSMKIKRTEAFTENISGIPYFAQNTGGKYRIFYNTGSNLANLQIPVIPKAVFQSKNTGLLQYVENNEIKTNYFICEGLKFNLHTDFSLCELKYFAFQPADKLHGYIYEPSDDEIIIRQTQNFEKISSIKTNLVSNNSKLFFTKSGIICFENENLFLMNKK